ncbi:MAG: DUF763 domain-containing protein [Minisyncoccia bacterium]
MIERGCATFGLDYGKCPPWLFQRMVKLSSIMLDIIVEEFGPDYFVKNISDPVWFQSLGTVLAFDWNSSGLTTILTAALKQAIKGKEKDLGIFICGGKGKTSKKVPGEIMNWGDILGLPQPTVESFVYNSKMAAKVDSALIQDGYQIYHHTFIFSKNGVWSVIQQGMNIKNLSARRYHWYSKKFTDLINEPHSGIISQYKFPSVLNLTSQASSLNREISTQLTQQNISSLMKDIKLLRKHLTPLSKVAEIELNGQQRLKFLELKNTEFKFHPVIEEKFLFNKYLDKILWNLCEIKPNSYEKLLSLQGVGPKTIRALSLVAEIIYGAKPSYLDPARYSFAHGGKDATPYPVDITTYDQTVNFLKSLLLKRKQKHSI